MGWETDQPVINYLKRRVKYYKEKRGQVSRMADEPVLLKQWKKSDLKRAVKERVRHYDDRIKEYTDAIELLSNPSKNR